LPPNPLELLSRASFAALLAKAQCEYDVIIIDTPPLGLYADAQCVAFRAADVLLVTRQHQTRLADTERAVRDLTDAARAWSAPDERLLSRCDGRDDPASRVREHRLGAGGARHGGARRRLGLRARRGRDRRAVHRARATRQRRGAARLPRGRGAPPS
jgi:hypothetical protein